MFPWTWIMPLYEYQCDTCGHRFERIQKFSDPPVAVCPTCGGAVRKLLSSPAIQFKGSGFYITDYVKSGADAGKADKKSAEPASGSESAADAKAKPAASPESPSTESSKKTETPKAPASTTAKT
jgi:putative FmdB family regulatory protein